MPTEQLWNSDGWGSTNPTWPRRCDLPTLPRRPFLGLWTKTSWSGPQSASTTAKECKVGPTTCGTHCGSTSRTRCGSANAPTPTHTIRHTWQRRRLRRSRKTSMTSTTYQVVWQFGFNHSISDLDDWRYQNFHCIGHFWALVYNYFRWIDIKVHKALLCNVSKSTYFVPKCYVVKNKLILRLFE